MKRKGVQLILIVLILILCSFPFHAFGSLQNDLGYNDSYIDNGAEQNHNLMFIPLPPDDDNSKNYMILYSPSKDTYYFYVADSYVSWFDFWGSTVVNGSWHCYEYKNGFSNSWEAADIEITDPNGYRWATFPSDYEILDSSIRTEGHWGSRVMFTQKTGYRTYWTLSILFIFVLDKIDEVSSYILSVTLIRVAFLLLFAGELIIFVIHLFRKAGDLKNA
ncbi:MAG: hypothetical protein IJT65_05830 [Eubacterium sp.]|nr:hypothetical protein [Eubacterium sp.]